MAYKVLLYLVFYSASEVYCCLNKKVSRKLVLQGACISYQILSYLYFLNYLYLITSLYLM